jgi:hypothetical protein
LSKANPEELYFKPLHSQRVTAGCGVSAFSVISPCFFEDETGSVVPVTSDWHVHMVNEFLFTELHCHDTDLATVFYQEDKARYTLLGS